MEKKSNKEINDQIEVNQMAGMPLEEAIYQAGYSHGVEFEQKRKQAIALGLVQPAEVERGRGAVWVKASEYDASKGGVVFYRFNGDTLKSIGIGHFVGDVFYGINSDMFPKWDWNYLYLLDESAGEKDDWISVDERLPVESGRYWCYVQHLTDLGFSYFQWNCDYNAQLQRFSDMTLKDGENVTHWRRLPPPPKTLPQWTQSNSLT